MAKWGFIKIIVLGSIFFGIILFFPFFLLTSGLTSQSLAIAILAALYAIIYIVLLMLHKLLKARGF